MKKEKKRINKQIGARIKAAREAAEYTQEQFAEKVDLSIQHVSNLERGIAGPSIDAVIKMCKVLGVSCDYLLLGHSGKKDVSKVESKLDNLTPDQLLISSCHKGQELSSSCLKFITAGRCYDNSLHDRVTSFNSFHPLNLSRTIQMSVIPKRVQRPCNQSYLPMASY